MTVDQAIAQLKAHKTEVPTKWRSYLCRCDACMIARNVLREAILNAPEEKTDANN